LPRVVITSGFTVQTKCFKIDKISLATTLLGFSELYQLLEMAASYDGVKIFTLQHLALPPGGDSMEKRGL